MANTSTSSAVAPLATSYASSRSDVPASRSVTAVVSHASPPAITGDDQPRPGTGTFQVTFSVSLQVSGTDASGACPCPVGPRNCGQSLA